MRGLRGRRHTCILSLGWHPERRSLSGGYRRHSCLYSCIRPVLRPFIDQIKYPTTFAQVHPTIETERYLMFYILRCHSYKPYVDEHYYIYDKKDNQIYKMTDYPGNSYWTLMDDYPHITNWSTTQNSNVAVRTRQVYALQEAEGKHGDAELKKLIETLDDDANPVLQIMLFHTVDQIKK